MSIMLQLSSLALKGAAQAVGMEGIGGGADAVVGFLSQRFVDQSQRLNKALGRANDRAWRTVEVALAGRSWWDRCKLVLTTAQERAFRNQVQAFLEAHPLDGVNGFGPDFRAQCLAQLQGARKAGLFKKGPPSPEELARHVGDLTRFGDPVARIEAEHRAVVAIAVHLRKHGYEALATFLELRPASGPPVLAAAASYFFQREVEHDRELFQGLAYAQLQDLSQDQSAGFSSLAEALDEHGERLETMLSDVHAVVVQTHGDVLDMKAELQRQGQQMQELGNAVLRALQQHQLEKRELHGGDSLSVRDEDERRLVKDLVKRYRSLPAEERKQMPALLNAVGKLEVVAGEFESAERDFRELAEMVPDLSARAEAAHNAFLAALERRAWPEAMTSLTEAARLDPARFAPFPTEKFEPERILGAGGFGVAFLCRNTRSGGRVVIKTLRSDGLARDLGDVFREAQTLEELEHPAIIRVRDCDYADAGRTRPYLVMDYFSGQTLAEHVEQNGPVTVGNLLPLARLTAEGLQRAHERGILHRDIKPANLLVRQAEKGWEAKLIDFGLAMRAEMPGSTMRAALDHTLAGSSIAGTLDYGAPEQMGKLKGVAVGPYSDVFGFGKTCCFALFGTPQPTFQHWQQLPRELADLLGRCLNEQPRSRPQDFASVLRELDRLMTPRTQPVPPMPKARVMDALPVAVRVEPPVAVRVEPPRPRRKRPLDELEEVEPPKRRGSGLVLTLLLLGVGVGFGAVLLFYSNLRNPRQPNWFGGGRTNLFGQAEKKAEPIKPEEFKGVLEKLEKKVSSEELREIAARLAETTPTTEQKKKHDEVKKAMSTSGGPKGPALDQMKAHDEIFQVSLALNPLLAKDSQPKDKLIAAQAMQKWGTSENVDWLIPYAGVKFEGVNDLRVNIHKALSAIGDKRGIPVVVARLSDSWDCGRGTIPALIAFGQAAEPEVLEYLDKPNQPGFNRGLANKFACQVLKEIGTQKSIPALNKIADQDVFAKGVAKEAIDAIQKRSK